MYDTFHANVEERRPEAAIRLIGQDIGVFHVSENDRGIVGRGHVPWAQTFRAIRATGRNRLASSDLLNAWTCRFIGS